MRLKILLMFIVSMASAVIAEEISRDWPEFRGPTGQGIAADSHLPLKWTKTENVTWKTQIPGKGWSSPIVYQGSVYLTTAITTKMSDEPDSLRALRVDAKTGDIIWDREVFAPKGKQKKHGKNSHASSTAIIENGQLYVHFGPTGTACLDVAGNILWRNSSLKYNPYHGNGGSPIIVGDKLIFNGDGMKEPFVAALNKNTGKVAWKVYRKENKASNKFSFCTPLLIEENGRKTVVSAGSGVVSGYDPENGNEIWSVYYRTGFSQIPRPVYGHGMVFVTTAFSNTKILAIRVGGAGDITDTHLAWITEGYVPQTPSILLVGKELYYISDKGTATCTDAISGKQHWQKRIGGKVSASPICADNRIYFITEKGRIVVIKAATKFEKLAENDLDERTYASPAVSANALFIRTESLLYRIEEDS